MIPLSLLLMLLLPLNARLSLARGGMSGMRGGGIHHVGTSLNRPANPEPQEPLIVDRCRAQELSPGGALAIPVVLATGSAVHMPGSLTIPRRSRLYRLVPELGLADTFQHRLSRDAWRLRSPKNPPPLGHGRPYASPFQTRQQFLVAEARTGLNT